MQHIAHTPWKLSEHDTGAITENGKTVMEACGADIVVRRERAERVVLAVNNHAALLEALEYLFAQASEVNKGERSLINISTARAAIAAAKGA